MKIAVNARFLRKNRLEGVGRFSCETLKYMTRQHPEHQFIFLFDRPYDSSFLFANNIEPKVIGLPARHPLLWYAWFEWAVPRALKQTKTDLFLSLDGFCSLSTDLPTLLVVHDLAFEHFPEQVPFWVSKYYRHFSPKYAQKASHIATVSQYTKMDVYKQYNIPLDKISVVYNGASAIYQPLEIAEKQLVKEQYTKGCDYFLFVGAIHPRKNLANILRAFDNFRQKQDTNLKLVVAGRKAWQSKEAFSVYQQMAFKDEVIFLGHLQIEVLAKVLGAAHALVYASIFEGFGIPIIEAFRCETPVITSHVSSMPEVAGDAALLVDPHSVDQIEEAMTQMYVDEKLCNHLITKSRQQIQRFGWEKTGERLWQAVEKVALKHQLV